MVLAHGWLKCVDPVDVLLIDPQYTPAMLFDDKAEVSERMVSLISAAAGKENINLFRRWALMRHWHVHNNMGLDRFFDPTDPDKLHQSDWSTLLTAKALGDAITRTPPAGAELRWPRLPAPIAKICRSFVSRMQNRPAIAACRSIQGLENIMMRHLPDHGLPLVQLKEQRRDLVVALQNRNGPVGGWELIQIAAVQQAISAFEDVIADLDAEMEMEAAA